MSKNISRLNNLGKQLDTSDQYLKGWSGAQHHQPSPPSRPPKRKPIDSKVDVKWEFLLADQALSYGLSHSSQAVRNVVKGALEVDEVEKAQKQAAELEKLKRQKFEKKLQSRNSQRYQTYRKAQNQAETSIRADANPETHRRREFRHQESLREKQMLVKDPSAWRGNLSPESRQKLNQRENRDLRKLEDSSAPTAADRSALRSRLAEDEKKVLPNKSGWLKSLLPEHRQRFLQRQARDEASILSSGMKANQAKDVIKDVATLGASSAQKKEGLPGAAKELLSLGIHGLAKSGGEDLGKGQTYLEQARNADRSGSYISSLQFRQQGELIQSRGALSTGLAVIGVNSMRPLLSNGATRAYWAIEEAIVKRRPIGPGLRASAQNEVTLAQQAQLTTMFEEVGGDPSKLVFNQGRQTGYVDSKDIIRVRGDVFPSSHRIHPRSRMTPRAVLAHERGHEAHRGTKLAVGSWNDEFRASYWAAKNAPGLSVEERASLITDCIERAREGGVPIKMNAFMRKTLCGY